jgi:flavin reductase (DIM6/NTAB) family NADH-FMN oxidoreductase RutF
MEIRVSREGGIRIIDDSNFKKFLVRTERELSTGMADALTQIAKVESSSHAWVHPAKIRALVSRDGDDEWEAGFAEMLSYAKVRGWISPDGAIRAHIEHMDCKSPAIATVPVADFKAAMRNLAGGISIVATGAGTGRKGMTVSAVTSVSADPPTVLICINKGAESHDSIVTLEKFSVNFLKDGHSELAMHFAGQTGIKGVERFGFGNWTTGLMDIPVLEDALSFVECEVISRTPIGSHSLFVGRVVNTKSQSGRPLVNFQGLLHSL